MDSRKNGPWNGFRAGIPGLAGSCAEPVCGRNVLPSLRDPGAHYAPSTLRRRDDDLRRRRLLSGVPPGGREHLLPQGSVGAFRPGFGPVRQAPACQVPCGSGEDTGGPHIPWKHLRLLRYHKAYRPFLRSPDGETGRRSGLKIRRPQGRGGSNPPPGTKHMCQVPRRGQVDLFSLAQPRSSRPSQADGVASHLAFQRNQAHRKRYGKPGCAGCWQPGDGAICCLNSKRTDALPA